MLMHARCRSLQVLWVCEAETARTTRPYLMAAPVPVGPRPLRGWPCSREHASNIDWPRRTRTESSAGLGWSRVDAPLVGLAGLAAPGGTTTVGHAEAFARHANLNLGHAEAFTRHTENLSLGHWPTAQDTFAIGR